MQRVDFKQIKAQVGIDDVAYRLGYRIDKRAGLGRHIEMVLANGSGGASDKIIIKNPQDKANQLYFRRDGRGGGDVITFIREHLTELGASSKNQWEAITQILADFSNTYIEESKQYLERVGYKGVQVFDKTRYDTKPITENMAFTSRFFEARGLTMATAAMFADKITLIRDLQNTAYTTYNLGFPYTRPSSDTIVGYEVRGYKGFKSKVAGTDSSNAAWIVDLSSDQVATTKRHVFFTESAFDAMAFYQANRNALDLSSSVFVSIGGTFSENQIKSVMQHYPNACAVDCYDNDIAGKLYGVRMLAVLNDVKIDVTHSEGVVKLQLGDKVCAFVERELTPMRVAKALGLTTRVEAWKAPKQFKDWNDMILNKSFATPSKYEHSECLRQHRSFKR